MSSRPAATGHTTLHISVLDTGIGIPEDKQAAVFQAFTQADGSTTRRYGGTGLGLTISAQLVSLMHGRIWVDSTPGRGSAFQFEVTLPLSASAVPPLQLVTSDELSGLAALVVDDNATSVRILTDMLTTWGVHVTAAHDAADATRAVEQARHGFTLAIIDMNLPGTSGVDLAATLRRHPRCSATSVLILGSSDQTHDARDVSAIGNARHLVKPVGRAALLEILRALLGSRTSPEKRPLAPNVTPIRAARQLRVLVAEDNPVNRKLAEHLLKRRGHDAILVANGREAVDALAGSRVDLVLMDLQMPEMDGFEATAAIRAAERRAGTRLPIVALTAHAMEGDRQRCLDADMDGYVTKPINAVELFEVIDRVFAAAHTTTTARAV